MRMYGGADSDSQLCTLFTTCALLEYRHSRVFYAGRGVCPRHTVFRCANISIA
jgi:hypothetical protein